MCSNRLSIIEIVKTECALFKVLNGILYVQENNRTIWKTAGNKIPVEYQ